MEMPAAKLPNVGPAQFLREVIAELKKVDWPSREQTIKLTVVVFIISAVVALFIGGLDTLMINLTSAVFKR
jgi:preprotein translocase subunit SecE